MMSRTMYAAAQFSIGKARGEGFDSLFDWLEDRELGRKMVRRHIRSIGSDVDREIALWMHDDGIGERATDGDIVRVLARSRLQEIESLYGRRVRMAAARGRRQGNYSALRCFAREVRRCRSDMRRAAQTVAF